MKKLGTAVLPAHHLTTISGHNVSIGYEDPSNPGHYVGYIKVAGNPKTFCCLFDRDGKDVSFGGQHDITPDSMSSLRMTGEGLMEAINRGEAAYHV